MRFNHDRAPIPECMWAGGAISLTWNVSDLRAGPTSQVVITSLVYGAAFLALLIWALKRAELFGIAQGAQRFRSIAFMTGSLLVAIGRPTAGAALAIVLATVVYYVVTTWSQRCASGASSPRQAETH